MRDEHSEMAESAWWRAVEARDGQWDGVFVFAVTTTGIYCRPSCPARRPKRQNVRFFALNGEAEAAGFRACRRCDPRDISLAQRHSALIEGTCRLIEARLASGEGAPRLDELAAAANLSKFHLQRLFKSTMGVSPAVYAKAKSEAALRARLPAGEGVVQAIFDAGMASTATFYARARHVLGMTPADYRQGGRFQKLWYAFAPTRFGLMIVAGTIQGVSAMRFGAGEAELRTELAALFPRAELVAAGSALAQEVSRIAAHVDMPEGLFEMPVDIQGSVFQHQVWRALTAIAFGETRTYSELASDIGKPKAVRAVANACGANPLAVAIPCHRVVRGDGSLGGYRWGTERKTALLAQEGSLPAGAAQAHRTRSAR